MASNSSTWRAGCAAAVMAACGLAASAQSLSVYSEFERPDPFGGIAKPDRGSPPREILSPAAARNAFASFHVAVTPAPGQTAFVYLQQNPERFRFTLYRERFVETTKGWVPDRLERVTLPAQAGPDIEAPGQTTYAFWLDVWVPADAPVARVRVEVVGKFGDLWVQYPLEVRVMPAVVPALRAMGGRLPPASSRSDAFACALAGAAEAPPPTVRALIFRNALQDRAIAAAKKVPWAGCRSRHEDGGPEWYLKMRDALLQSVAGDQSFYKHSPT